MTRSGIEQLLYMMDSAFEGKDWHSVLRNLGSVKDHEWDWAPPGGSRTIRSLIKELGECKQVYNSHAFGDGSVLWAKGTVCPMPEGVSNAEVLDWLCGAHAGLREHLAALPDDAMLTDQVMSQWGRIVERRFLIRTVIEHDLYHSGEINHIRALAQGNDYD